MTEPSPIVALAMHLALLSSISFGGFPAVLPDLRHFVVDTNGWTTAQEFTNLFAMAQSIPGPNMILMMSFIGWKVWGLPGAVVSAFATIGPPCLMLLRRLPAMGSVPRRVMARGHPPRPDPGRGWACRRRRYGDGPRGGYKLVGRRGHDRCGRAYAVHTAQSDMAAPRGRCSGWCWRLLARFGPIRGRLRIRVKSGHKAISNGSGWGLRGAEVG